jgi:hypothetical protein
LDQTILVSNSKPWTRWWWFASEISKQDITDNLIWLKKQGFGGVEIAWVYPLNRMKKDTVHYTPRQAWQSPEWSGMVAVAKRCADSLQLGCDFTFGSLWPFGDTKVPPEEATMNMTDLKWRQEITASWDYPRKGLVIDHLSQEAFSHYADRMGNALKSSMAGSPSGLFCDSWEVETRHLTTPVLSKMFNDRYGYSIMDYKDSLYSNLQPFPMIRYDYMKLVSNLVINQFYKPFTEKAHELGGYSRVQCSGAPADIISAYAMADVPESEALLYEPAYSNIVASSAVITGKPVVSCETFTCLYGWPADYHSKEQEADLKLVADAVFANGVNHIIWHGKPLNPAGYDTVKFYASVHVGKNGALAGSLSSFNQYLENVSGYMRQGRTYGRVAVYLPTEDAWIAGELPKDKQFIWAWGAYEMRYDKFPEELIPWRPLWINREFLSKAIFNDKLLQIGGLYAEALYVDAQYLDLISLEAIYKLASQGCPVVMVRDPKEAGYRPTVGYFHPLLEKLWCLPTVKRQWVDLENIKPVVTGLQGVDYWCRETDDGLIIFFANPRSYNLKFPLDYGQSLNDQRFSSDVEIQYMGHTIPCHLDFDPYQSVMIRISKHGKLFFQDIQYQPEKPVYEKRVKKGKERWEVR